MRAGAVLSVRLCALSVPLPQPYRPRGIHRFRPVGDLELRENVGDMVAHGLGTQDEASSDVGIGLALGDQGEDLVFAIRQLREELRRATLRGRASPAEVVDQA